MDLSIDLSRYRLNYEFIDDENDETIESALIILIGASQMERYYATLRLMFANMNSVVFRKTPTTPAVHHINGLGQLESAVWANWMAELTIESPSCGQWRNYAVYRLHPFGLRRINGRHISAADVADAQDRYGVLDDLVALLAPPNRIHRHMDRLAQLEIHPATPEDPDLGQSNQQVIVIWPGSFPSDFIQSDSIRFDPILSGEELETG